LSNESKGQDSLELKLKHFPAEIQKIDHFKLPPVKYADTPKTKPVELEDNNSVFYDSATKSIDIKKYIIAKFAGKNVAIAHIDKCRDTIFDEIKLIYFFIKKNENLWLGNYFYYEEKRDFYGNLIGYNILGAYLMEGYTGEVYWGKKTLDPSFISIDGSMIRKGEVLMLKLNDDISIFAKLKISEDFFETKKYSIKEALIVPSNNSTKSYNRIVVVGNRSKITSGSENGLLLEGVDYMKDENGRLVNDKYFEFYRKEFGVKKYGIIDISGNFITESDFENVFKISRNNQDYFKVKRDNLYGIVELNGSYLYEPVFDMFETDKSFIKDKGFGLVKYKGKYGLVNEKLEVILDPKYSEFYFLNKMYALVFDLNWDFLNLTTMKEIGLKIDEIQKDEIGKEEIPIKIKNYWGFCNRLGQIVIQPKYSFVTSFSEGVAIVATSQFLKNVVFPEKTIYLINKTGTIVKVLDHEFCKDISNVGICSDGLILFKSRAKGLFGYFNLEGKILIKPAFEDATNFINGKAFVKRFGTTYYIDKKGNRL